MSPHKSSAAPAQVREEIRSVVEPLFGRPPSDEAFSELALYLSETERWGARIDLTAARTRAEFLDLSLADAALLAKEEMASGAREDSLVDIGTGGGAPGIPLLSLLAQERAPLAGALVEPRTKRVAFLRSVVGQLKLPEVQVVRARSDTLSAQSFDVAVARATLPPPAWLKEGGRLARGAVWVLLAREDAPECVGWVIQRDVTYQWPLTGARRRAVRYIPAEG